MARSQAANLEFESWMQESHAFAKASVYTPEMIEIALAVDKGHHNSKSKSMTLSVKHLDKNYREGASRLSKRRGIESGFRLARCLKMIAQ